MWRKKYIYPSSGEAYGCSGNAAKPDKFPISLLNSVKISTAEDFLLAEALLYYKNMGEK